MTRHTVALILPFLLYLFTHVESWSARTSLRRKKHPNTVKWAAKVSPTEESNRIYSMPGLYDLAFGYRDYDQEVQFLFNTHEKICKKVPKRTLELAAGPGRHSLTAIELYDDLETAHCVDLSKEMAAYAKEVAIEELPVDFQHKFHYTIGDMRDFSIETGLFDTAWILLGSLQHLTTNDEVVQCFKCIYKHLQPKGTLIIELPHPRETFTMVDCTRNGWKVPLEDEDGKESGTLNIVWGDENDEFDPITQVRQFTVAMEINGIQVSSEIQNVREIVPMRLFTSQEIDALGRLADFKLHSLYGALEQGVSVDDEDTAFRLVCVLQK